MRDVSRRVGSWEGGAQGPRAGGGGSVPGPGGKAESESRWGARRPAEGTDG